MLFIGNLKNHIPTQEYINKLISYTFADEVWLSVPLVYIAKYGEQLKNANIKIGSQCVDLEQDFANRGEVFANMLKDVGTDFVFLGHQTDKKFTSADYERRRQKIKSIIDAGMIAVVAVGENMEECETGKVYQVVEKQIKEIFKGLDCDYSYDNLIIAYEPKWAIGTGLSVCTDDLETIIRNIKSMVESYGKGKYRLMFGGSCNVDNMPHYSQVEDIDGFVLSTASLDAEQFAHILCGVKNK